MKHLNAHNLFAIVLALFFALEDKRCLCEDNNAQSASQDVYNTLQNAWDRGQEVAPDTTEAYGNSCISFRKKFDCLTKDELKHLQQFVNSHSLEPSDFNVLLTSFMVVKAINEDDVETTKAILLSNAVLLTGGIDGEYLEFAIASHDVKELNILFDTYELAKMQRRNDMSEAIAECLRRAFCNINDAKQLNDDHFVLQAKSWFDRNLKSLHLKTKYVKPSGIGASGSSRRIDESLYGLFAVDE